MRRQRQSGFSLIELSVVLVIVALVSAGGIAILRGSISQRQQEETVAKLAKIEEILLYYRRAFNRLPCPGDITLAPTAGNFGIEAANPGTCTGGTPVANFGPAATHVIAGMLPVKTLQLDDEYAFDGWGRRFMYVIDRRFTDVEAFNNIVVSDQTTGAVVINDTNDDLRTDHGVYVVTSFGENGHGGYPRAGSTSRRDADSTNVHELENCDCNANAVSGTFDQEFVQRAPGSNDASDDTDYFDDVVVYKVRGLLRSLTE